MTVRDRDAAWLESLRCRRAVCPEVFVETGTYRGETTRLALQQFKEVHTIERDDALYAEVSPTLKDEGAYCWHGDSAEFVPRMVTLFEVPVFWFLDAHWIPDAPELGPTPTPLPLWEELRAIATRSQRDIIVVDDLLCFGNGPQPEWEQVTVERIADLFPDAVEVVVQDNQLAVYR